MKSVKSKLFASFALVIFCILVLLSFMSVKFFDYSQKNDIYEAIYSLMDTTYDFVEEYSDKDIKELDRFIELKNYFTIVRKNQELIYSSESTYKTNRIIEEVYEEFEQQADDKYPKQVNSHDENAGLSSAEFIEEDEFILLFEVIEKPHGVYEVFTGIDENAQELQMENVIAAVIVLNLTIFVILLFLAYMLINKTIKPLKEMLTQMKQLRQGDDLSKRLIVHKSNDEFETLSITFNEMLNNIEKSVENIKQFSSDASHELKTPLTIIQGQVELCQKENISKEALLEAMNKVNQEQLKLQEIIQNFLLLSRLDKEPINQEKSLLDIVMFDVIEHNLFALEQKQLQLELEIDEGIEVNFNHKYLYMVLNNLMTNAIKYTNDGFIKVSIHQNEKPYVEIIDSGIGISNNDLEKIFERFFRVDKVRTQAEDGVGLGLSIVKKICEHFEARISVSSQLDKGSCFRIEFN